MNPKSTGSGDVEAGHRPGLILHITDQGATSPEATPCTTDLAAPSALGGHSSALSNTAKGDYPPPAEDGG
jgi:hypothetical protein